MNIKKLGQTAQPVHGPSHSNCENKTTPDPNLQKRKLSVEQLCSRGDKQQRGEKIEPNVQQEAVKRFQLSRLSPLQQLASCWWRRRLSAPSTVLVAVVAADVGGLEPRRQGREEKPGSRLVWGLMENGGSRS